MFRYIKKKKTCTWVCQIIKGLYCNAQNETVVSRTQAYINLMPWQTDAELIQYVQKQ
jgi:hypothetical protein